MPNDLTPSVSAPPLYISPNARPQHGQHPSTGSAMHRAIAFFAVEHDNMPLVPMGMSC